MQKIKALPDLSGSFRLLTFSLRLEAVSPATVLGAAIRAAVDEGRIRDAISMIAECAADNWAMMVDIVGGDLLTDIVKFTKK